jgi:hypothetical protein
MRRVRSIFHPDNFIFVAPIQTDDTQRQQLEWNNQGSFPPPHEIAPIHQSGSNHLSPHV